MNIRHAQNVGRNLIDMEKYPDPFGSYFGAILEPFLGHLGLILEVSWDHLGALFGTCLDGVLF